MAIEKSENPYPLMVLSVCSPVADLLKEPRDPDPHLRDDFRESQLLANESFHVQREWQDWYYGEAIEQPYLAETGWSGYPGWIRKSKLTNIEDTKRQNAIIVSQEANVFPDRERRHVPLLTLPLGSRVRVEPDSQIMPPSSRLVYLRSGQGGWVRSDSLGLLEYSETGFMAGSLSGKVIKNAFLFVGIPYLWGGMNASAAVGPPEAPWGIDCSALVCLSCRLSGIDVPRNAHDQWMWAHPIEKDGLRRGDLVFVARKEAQRIRHVMICTGSESLIEASETGRTVSETTFKEKFGFTCEELKKGGFPEGERRLYFGRITKGLAQKILCSAEKDGK